MSDDTTTLNVPSYAVFNSGTAGPTNLFAAVAIFVVAGSAYSLGMLYSMPGLKSAKQPFLKA
jgi:hypothetical protein